MSICNACGSLGQSRHTKDFSCNRYNHFGTVINHYILDMELEIIHGAINLRIGRERVLCLGNTNRIMSDSHFLNQLDTVAGDAAVRNDAGSIKVGSHLSQSSAVCCLLLYTYNAKVRTGLFSIVSTTGRAISTAPSPPSLNALLMA